MPGGGAAQQMETRSLLEGDDARGVGARSRPWRARSRRGRREKRWRSALARRGPLLSMQRGIMAGRPSELELQSRAAGSAVGAPDGGRSTAPHDSRLPAPAGARGAWGDRASHVGRSLSNLPA